MKETLKKFFDYFVVGAIPSTVVFDFFNKNATFGDVYLALALFGTTLALEKIFTKRKKTVEELEREVEELRKKIDSMEEG